VQVGQTRLDMALPREVRPGDSVRLVYMTSGPRPTFQLVQTPVAAVQSVRLSDGAQQVNALVRFAQAGAATPGVASSPAPGVNAAQAGSATPAQAGQAGQAAAAQGGMAAARPIIANVALLNAASASPPLTSAMTGGAANPTMALVGQAVDAARPGLATHASLLTQGIITEQNASGNVLPHDIPYCRRHQYLSRRLPGTGCCSPCSGGLPAWAMPAADGRCAVRRI
jgi:hypothetical protein